MKKVTVLAVLLSLLVVSFPAAASAQSLGITSSDSDTATLYFVQGFISGSLGADEGQPFNVVLNDVQCLAKEVRFGEIAGAFRLPQGNYKLAIVPPEAGCSAQGAVARIALSLTAGQNVSVVAHVNEQAKPALSAFVNFDAWSIDPSGAEIFSPYLAVRNTSTVSPMNVVAAESIKGGARYAFQNLYPGDEAARNVTSGRWQVTFYEPSPFSGAYGRTILGLQREFKSGVAYFFYAVGSTQAGTFQVLEHTLPIP